MNTPRYMIVTAQPRYERTFDLERTAELTGIHPEMIVKFVHAHLVHLVDPNLDRPIFDEFAIARLRQIQHLRQRQRLSMRSVRYIVGLLDELHATKSELRALRERMR